MVAHKTQLAKKIAMVQQDIVSVRVLNKQDTVANERYVYLKHSEYHVGSGIAGVLTFPVSAGFPSFKERVVKEGEYGFPQHKLVLLLHGHSSHKNAVYLPLLAKTLGDMGYYVLRIDFRNMGDSEPNRDEKVGRTISQDCEDIETVFQFVSTEQCRELVGHYLTLDTIVAHSRGVMSMFEFARTRYVPNLVNACGRFVASGLYEKSRRRNPNWDKEGGFKCSMLRYGKIQELWIPKSETLSAATVDTAKFAEIDPRTWVMSIYGSYDDVIPLSAITQYSNLFEGRHTSDMVMYADHNFYGLPDDPNVHDLPLRKGKVNYNFVAVERIAAHLQPEKQLQRFYKVSSQIASKQNPADIMSRWPLPFNFSHVSNFRDLGGFKTTNGRRVKPGVFFRCANPCDITSDAMEYMTQRLHVSKVFDLRSTAEAKEHGAIKGIEVENLPLNDHQSLAPEDLAKHYQGLLLSPYMFPQAYLVITRNSAPRLKTFFQYIIDGKCDSQHAVLFHCAAGKDRTGILAMLILAILGVDDDTISREYELTALGLKTEQKLIDMMEKRGDVFYEMLGSRELAKEYNVDPKIMCRNVLSSKYEAMRLFIDKFNAEYGSVERFFLNTLGFEPKDIETIRNTLLE